MANDDEMQGYTLHEAPGQSTGFSPLQSGRRIGRVPPHSIEAEQAVLGGILLDNRALDRASGVLAPEDFYAEKHQRVYLALLALDEAREPADIVTLTDMLRRRGDLESFGGPVAVAELSERTATAANVEFYARIVHEKAILRRLNEVGTDISEEALAGRTSADELLESAEARVFALRGRGIGSNFEAMEPIVRRSLERVEALYNRPEGLTGVPSGFLELDKLTSGFQEGDLIILAARPAMGKSALATNIAEHVAERTGKAVALFSLEMSKESLVLRMLCGRGRVDSNKVRIGRMSGREYADIANAAASLSEMPLYIDDAAALSVLDIRARTRRLMREHAHGLGLIVIDYLQLMRAHSRTDNREQEISQISRSLKALAKELQVPVVALSQLNRSVESRTDKRPLLADLRESGAIEQDADVILFIYRDEYYNRGASAEPGVAEVIIAKQRNGPTGVAKLAFRGEFTLFQNLGHGEDESATMPEAFGDFGV